ncbi:MAG TPA: ACT domain-containing protein [Candidatus Acidoferrum sp.]|nr:ACT domain-containing protein [Candidatus Acidoferrum sp.]
MPPANRILTLSVMEGLYAIVKLPSDAEIPAWAAGSAFFSVTRTLDELSVVSAEASVPLELNASRGWRMLKVHGPSAFEETGVVAALANPLARVGVGIFVISTFDTDYLLVQQEEIPVAVETLEHAGHTILGLGLLNS